MKKIRILTIILCVMFLVGNMYVYASGIQRPTTPSGGSGHIGKVTDLADNIWATAIIIVQVVSISCVVFAGVRYMYAAADKKADLKKGLFYLAIGAIFVFAASTVIKFIFSIGDSLI